MAADSLKIATLLLPDGAGSLMLRHGDPSAGDTRRFIWSAADPARAKELELLVSLADDYSNPPEYVYGPADGAPGRVAAQRVQGLLGGALRYEPLPKTAPAPEGEEMVY